MTDEQALQLKPGDKVIYVKHGLYNITNEKTVCEFIRIATEDDLCYDSSGSNKTFIIISPVKGNFSINDFTVNSSNFEKFVDVSNVKIDERKLMSLLQVDA